MRISVFCPNWVGDAVMATPTLRALRRHYPDATIVGLMRPVVADTLAGNPWIDEVIHFDYKSKRPELRWWAVARQMRQQRCDLAVLMTNSFVSAWTAWLGRARQRVGYDRDSRRLLLTDALPSRWWRRNAHPSPVIDSYLSLAYHLGADREAPVMQLFVDPEAVNRATEFLRRRHIGSQDRLVIFNPGSAFGPAKRWPTASFAELARRTTADLQVKVLVLAGPGEEELAQQIVQQADRPNQVFGLGEERPTIGLTKALVQQSAAMVSTDSGPRHFAAAFDVPIVALFGPTHIHWTETYFPGELRLQEPVSCGPCQQRTCPLQHHRCMTDLTVDRVAAALQQLLARPLRKSA